MRLYEYEVKQIFAEKGIPVPRGIITSSPTEAAVFTKELNKPVLVKAQILVGGRGKAGGILAARTPEEAEEASKKLLSTKIKGLVVKKVLIEEMLPVMKEIYLSIALDTSKGKPVLLASSEGGIDIEKVAAKYPEKIVRREVDPLSSFELYEARKFLKKIGLTGTPLIKVAETLQRLYNIFEELDATIAEINPLIITPSGDVFAA
ncbi:succinate--CoA ligase subunit beta, partial [Candidatus Aerophobetes bacterium]